jgi:hypothetical protein
MTKVNKLACYALAIILLVGCSDRKDERPLMAMQACEQILHKKEFSPSAKGIAKQTLAQWQNNVLDPVPVLMDAQYTHTKTGELYLDLYMSDEDFDVAGIIVSEIHKDSGKPDIAFEEKYPVFADYSAGLPEQLHVYIRAFPELRKSEEKWKSYVQKGSYVEGYPPIKVSIPSPYIAVSLSVYDENGHVSNAAPLTRSSYSYPLPPEFNEVPLASDEEQTKDLQDVNSPD